MKKEIIKSGNVPEAIGPYSQAIKSGELIFTSGQIPISPKTNLLVEGNIKTQTIQVLDNLKNLLESSGSSLGKVIKATIYLTDLNDFNRVNEIYATYFNENPPARSCVQVSALPKGASIEIEVIATI